MAARPDVFLDTSALFAGIWSATGGARMILKLGEAGAIRLRVSSQVLTELENALRRKGPKTLGVLALLLDRSSVNVVPEPAPDVLKGCQSLIDHRADAGILAAAWSAGVGYFVTLDRRHFLDDLALVKAVPFPIGTPGDFLGWYTAHLEST